MTSSCGTAITSGRLIDSLPSKLDTVLQVKSLLMRLNWCHICSGNAVENREGFTDGEKKSMLLSVET